MKTSRWWDERASTEWDCFNLSPTPETPIGTSRPGRLFDRPRTAALPPEDLVALYAERAEQIERDGWNPEKGAPNWVSIFNDKQGEKVAGAEVEQMNANTSKASRCARTSSVHARPQQLRGARLALGGAEVSGC